MSDQRQPIANSPTPEAWPLTAFIPVAVMVILAMALLIGCHFFLKPLMAVVLFALGPIAAIAFDCLSLRKRQGRVSTPSAGTNETLHYHQNLQIWGLGIVMGAGAAVIYIIATVSLAPIEVSVPSEHVVWQHLGQSAIAFLTLALIVWAAVRIASTE